MKLSSKKYIPYLFVFVFAVIVIFLISKYAVNDSAVTITENSQLDPADINRLNQLVLNDDNAATKGIGVRILDDNRTIILMYEVKTPEVLNKITSRPLELNQFLQQITCPLLSDMTETGGDIGYEYYYQDNNPIMQIIVDKQNCNTN